MEGSLSSSSKGTVVNRTEIELVSCGGCNWKLKLLRRRRRSFTGVAVGDVNGALERGAEKDTDDALASVLGDTVVVVDYAQQHQRVNHHFLYRSPRYLLRLYHIHRCLFSYSYSNFTDSFSPEPYFLLFLLYQSINQSINQPISPSLFFFLSYFRSHLKPSVRLKSRLKHKPLLSPFWAIRTDQITDYAVSPNYIGPTIKRK